MRITGGFLKGRRINIPGSSPIRPSTDMLREAIFSIIGGDVSGAAVADLFCGSGALGIEALSRGADNALFVDASRHSISILGKNLQSLELLDRSRLVAMDVLKLRPSMVENISLILADPPYNMGLAGSLISLLSLPKFGWRGIIVIEHESGWRYSGSEMVTLNRRVYGDTAVTFLGKDGR